MLMAEGTVSLRKKGGTIKFTNTSEKLQNLFKQIAKKLGYKTKRKDEKNIVIYSTELARKLLKLCKSFRVKPFKYKNKLIYSPAQLPEKIFKLPKREIKELLRIYFSCEGGVVVGKDKRNDEIILRVCHPRLQEQIMKLIKLVKIEAKKKRKRINLHKKKIRNGKICERNRIYRWRKICSRKTQRN